MLEIFDMYGIVDIKLGERNAQVYFSDNMWELFLSNGSMTCLNSKQDAIELGIKWVDGEALL